MQLVFSDLWPFIIAAIQAAAVLGTVAHAMLTKGDSKAAAGWVGFILFVPFLGWLIYLIFGVNRIQRRAVVLRGNRRHVFHALPSRGEIEVSGSTILPERAAKTPELAALARFSHKLLDESFDPGNAIHILENGDEAYPAMLRAIDEAKHSIALSTYIFNNDKAGRMFVEALSRARQRGLRVRILIDGVGSWYSFPSLIPLLEKHELNYARFLHSFMPWRMPYLNMRTHQKIMVVDGCVGFTGGINISEGNLVASKPRKPILDHHFRIDGPVVSQLMQTFAHEWEFTTDEILDGPDWFPSLEPKGEIVARGLAAGPDLDMNPVRWTLMGALAQAHERVRIVTPYFIPDTTLATNLSLAAMRGVTVDIVLPGTSNLPFVDWAATPQIAWMVQTGCRVWKSSGPFDHTKLMTVDGVWSTIGSANWDSRSLRLNFEFNLECYGSSFAHALDLIAEKKISRAQPVSYAELMRRPLPLRLRDAAFRLASPYL
jgi:cardiolipin synthase